MRKIKFRWETKDGKFSFCELKVENGALYFSANPNSSDMFFLAQNVVENSIAQLVGYDFEGKEVYEGDKVVDKYGHEMTAELSAFGVGRHGHFRVDWDCKGFEFKLKEGIKNA